MRRPAAKAPLSALALIAATATLAGCGATSDHALKVSMAALDSPTPAATTTSTSSTTAEPSCGDVTASLRPPAVMPAPGSIPAGSYMARIKQRGYLVAGVDQNTLLLAYFNPRRHEIEGFEIDLLREIANAIFGDKRGDLRLKAITTAQRIPAIQSGSVDIVADAMTITCARRRQVDFSTVYYDAKQKVLVPSNSPVRSVRDLSGKPVCAATGTTSLAKLEEVSSRPVPYPVGQRIDCLVALQENRVDAVTSDDSILLGFKAQDPYTKILPFALADEPYGMAIARSHPEFVRFVNGVLAQLRADGGWRRIFARWFGGLAPTPTPPPARYAG
jgi:polar amino acid transport system substrate-binding protein